jgi:hypothetical protein
VEEGGRVNPYAFFVGCPRSGTTLLGRIGDAHPELAVIHETRWIADWWEKRTGLTPKGHVTPALLERLYEHPRFAKLGIDRAAVDRLLEQDGYVAYADFVTGLFDLYGDLQHKRLVGDKTPRYVRSIPILSELWREARFVHLIRDGRDVCLSVLDWRKGAPNFSTWDEDAVSTTALWWEWHVRLGREAGAVLSPDQYHELHYESLVADSERECTALCEFLGLDYDASMLRFHEGRSRPKPGRSPKAAWLPVTGGLRDWKTTMHPDDVLRFEAAAGDLLEELGYPRAAASVPARALDHAARMRAQFAAQVQARRRPLPGAWQRFCSCCWRWASSRS